MTKQKHSHSSPITILSLYPVSTHRKKNKTKNSPFGFSGVDD